MSCNVERQESTFSAALPYGVGALALGSAGAITAVAATATAVKIIGIAMGIIGAYSFLAILGCGIFYAGNPQGFRENWAKTATVFVGHAVTEFITIAIKEVFYNILDTALGKKNTQTVSFR
ncbi:MAG: hypothetical protein WCT85_07185 [Parachlamydiales bacterium]|jgi:hypothetical protein